MSCRSAESNRVSIRRRYRSADPWRPHPVVGSGGADVSYYHQLSFHDGRFWDEQLGEKVLDRCWLNGQEVSEAEFDAWYAANMTNDVTWYSPDGTVQS